MKPGLLSWRRPELAEEIYILKNDGQLDPMREEKFDLENDLQQLVADHPELLSGQQMNPENPRRWILIDREQGISDILGGGNRWALDHLLIDQDAIPTLVEVKRSENSEIRRSIVGQMLDYAAHARHTWNVGDIRRVFEERTTAAGQDPSNVLAVLLETDGESDADEFWQQVEINLRAARLRLLFVADGIPDELTRVVEFLNEQMPGIEVLAVEIKQFRGETGRTLAPRVIGRTAAAPGRSPRSRHGQNLNEQALIGLCPGEEVQGAIKRLFEVAYNHRTTFNWSRGGVSIRALCPAWRSPVTVAWIYTPGWTGIVPGRLTFGAGSTGSDLFENAPPALCDTLENWAAQFEHDSYTRDVSGNGLKAWAIDSYEDAARNIDVLSERLDAVLNDLQRRGPAEEAS